MHYLKEKKYISLRIVNRNNETISYSGLGKKMKLLKPSMETPAKKRPLNMENVVATTN